MNSSSKSVRSAALTAGGIWPEAWNPFRRIYRQPPCRRPLSSHIRKPLHKGRHFLAELFCDAPLYIFTWGASVPFAVSLSWVGYFSDRASFKAPLREINLLLHLFPSGCSIVRILQRQVFFSLVQAVTPSFLIDGQVCPRRSHCPSSGFSKTRISCNGAVIPTPQRRPVNLGACSYHHIVAQGGMAIALLVPTPPRGTPPGKWCSYRPPLRSLR